MDAFAWILVATLTSSVLSMIGAVSLSLKPKTLEKLLGLLVAFSAGSLLGGAFLHLLGESLELMSFDEAVLILIAGFCLFFIMERFFKWHHCHKTSKCETHPFTYLILVGDGLHNFIDGLIIAASFLVSVPAGFLTTAMVIGHEIPQELGDFGVLIYGGLEKKKAILYNFLSQLTAVLGGIIGFFLSQSGVTIDFLLPFAAGGFI
ncbi:ZIP family metal transporter [archaeon]|nr:ZIP family metal transporter [archaeon]